MGTAGMRASLASREVIADSIELVVRRPHVRRGDRDQRLRQDDPRHRDGAVPAEPAEPDAVRRLDHARAATTGEQVTIQEVFEAVGAHAAGKITDAELTALEDVASPGRRRLRRPVHRQHDGDGVRGARDLAGRLLDGPGRPTPHKAEVARAGRAARDGRARARPAPERHHHPRQPRERDRRDRDAAAARPTACCTCSRSPARSGSSSTIDDFDRISERTPLLCDLKPGGRYVAPDLYAAGGVPVLLQAAQAGRAAARGRR